jgi:hypothetical protein
MAIVGRPPVLALCHQVGQVFFECGVVELFEFFVVIKACIHRVGYRLVLMQDGQVQLVGPPLCIGLGALLCACAACGVEWTFAGI